VEELKYQYENMEEKIEEELMKFPFQIESSQSKEKEYFKQKER